MSRKLKPRHIRLTIYPQGSITNSTRKRLLNVKRKLSHYQHARVENCRFSCAFVRSPRNKNFTTLGLSRSPSDGASISIVINRTIFFCNALELPERACCLLSFLYFHWLFPLSARETSPGNRSIYKSTRNRVDSKGLNGRCRLRLLGS